MAEWALYLAAMCVVYGFGVGGALAYKLHQHGKTIRAIANWTNTILDEMTKPKGTLSPPLSTLTDQPSPPLGQAPTVPSNQAQP